MRFVQSLLTKDKIDMKRIITIRLGVVLSLAVIQTTSMAAITTISETQQYSFAKDEVHLFSKIKEVEGKSVRRWYVESSSQNKVIKVTLQLNDGNQLLKKHLTLEPGQVLSTGLSHATDNSSAHLKLLRATYL